MGLIRASPPQGMQPYCEQPNWGPSQQPPIGREPGPPCAAASCLPTAHCITCTAAACCRDLGYNLLTGSLPAEWAVMPKLAYL